MVAWKQSPARVAVSAILLLACALGVWQIFFRQSSVEKGLVALNAAYREQRPLEARISNFDYAPFVVSRGPEPDKVNQKELNRAELTLLEALKNNPSSAVHHGLGKVYLAKRQFDNAIEQFDSAVKDDPNNAQLYADLGAAWLEKGKLNLERTEPGKGMAESGRGLENINKVLGLNPNSLEALFNRALCEEQLTLYSQAENDWREYLNRDSQSPWAEEAHRRVQLLEQKRNRGAQTKDALFKSFLRAHDSRDDDAAWTALSPSRGRTGNSIVESLFDEFFRLSAEGQTEAADAVLQRLSYAGDVEAAKTGDVFTRDLVHNFRTANALRREQTGEARKLIKQAVARYIKSEFKEAIDIFSEADKKFLESGDECNHMFVEALIGYSYLRLQKSDQALQIFQRLSKSFAAKNYKSMLAQSLFAQSDALNSKGEFSKALERSNESFALSQQIQDQANAIRCLQMTASVQLTFGDYNESLRATFRALKLAEELPPDPTRIWPFYHEAAIDFYSLGLPTPALLFGKEALRIAMTANTPLLISRSYDRLALLEKHLGNYAEAMKNNELARTEGEKIADHRMRTNVLAHAAMILGRLYRETGDAKRAVESFDTSLKLYEELEMNIYRYPAHKGKMLALMQLNDNERARAELDTTLSWLEDNREKIAEEGLRDKFFDTEQDTYEAAIDFTYSRMNDKVKALELAEASRARSLHDLMTKGARFPDDGKQPEFSSASVTPALEFEEIKRRMPERAQLLAYAVLADQIIIWVVRKDSIESETVKISRNELNEKTRRYLHLLTRPSPDRAEITNYARELYTTLIKPVEDHLDKNLQLCIVPDDKLNFVPFVSLVSPDSGNYLIEDYALQIAPSATVFITSTENAKLRQSGRSERLLVVGNPHFDRTRFDLPDLPASGREAEAIAKLYGATALTGDEAVVSRVKASLAEADVIHLATHAVTDNDSPLLSKLLLASVRDEMHHPSSSYITAADIYRMKLRRARLVVLSACQTGVEKTYRGEGAIGLARPFIAAGVPLVVGSLWPVESEATASLMISFHKHRKEGKPSVEALRHAQREAITNSKRSTFGWAAFVVMGGDAAF